MADVRTLEEIMAQADQLSPLEKIHLIENLIPQIAQALEPTAPAAPRRSLRGLWRGLDITDTDIAEARQEMWANFPREDI